MRHFRFWLTLFTVAVLSESEIVAAPPIDSAVSTTAARTDSGSASPGSATLSDVDFFEAKVRPLLLSACGKCHGEKKQWGSLRIDSRKSLLKGGDSGPAIVPGSLEGSLLISAIRRTGDLEMPPDDPLTPQQVAILEQWVKSGAVWPEGEVTSATSRLELQRNHWAFQPMSKPKPPAVSDALWCQTDIDRFVLSKLEANSLSHSPRADRRTLIRRLTYDLTGLPPTLKEVQAFINDRNPDAYVNLVDRLLESPHYGEHWGRHWLDLARYADTKGYVYAREEKRFVHSATYRDWVVRAFNNDMPYDRFLALQLAADQFAPDDLPAQAAMGFITLGRRFLGNDHDIIDDRIDVISRTTLGLTIACARCHDHKYDPIPTTDYYSLYGILNNSQEQLLRIGSSDASDKAVAAFEAELKKRMDALEKALKEGRDDVARRVRERMDDYLVAQLELEKYPDVSFGQLLKKTDILPVIVHRWQAALREFRKNEDPVFLPWHRYAALPEEDFAQQAEQVTREIQDLGSPAVNRLVAAAFDDSPQSMHEVAQRYGTLFIEVNAQWQALLAAALESKSSPPTELPDPDAEKLRTILYAPGSPCVVPDEGIVGTENFFDIKTTTDIWKLQNSVDQWLIQSPAAPPFTVRLVDNEIIEEPRVFRRGNPATKGDDVTRQLPQVIAELNPQPMTDGSGRRELVQGIIDPRNPLTARVWVNRLWAAHFGRGLVATPSDFGTRAPPPSHPELLDWLAQKLIETGWSTKAIHREILLSATYQQNSFGPDNDELRAQAVEADPQNRLCWRANRHRLSFEEMRDSMLSVSGELNSRIGGRGDSLFSKNARRTLYVFIDRQLLSNVFRVFDFANPDLHIAHRSETTVPQQALFEMNHPFVANRARALIKTLSDLQKASVADRIDFLYERIYQRPPTDSQRDSAMAFLDAAEQPEQSKVSPMSLAWTYGYGAIDLENKKITNFQRLPYRAPAAFQGGVKWPDAKLGWAQLTATGGHPGNDHQHAVVRRWTSPISGSISIQSLVKHEPKAGNGIRCWLVSSRQGLLHRIELHKAERKLNVEKLDVQPGDTLDFIVDINGQLHSDQFLWSAKIERTGSLEDVSSEDAVGANWDSIRDFGEPVIDYLNKWEQLAQVLLLTNEFQFVD